MPMLLTRTRELAGRLAAAGAHVEEVSIGWDDRALWAFRTHAAAIFGGWAAPYLVTHRHLMTDYAVAFAETAERLTAVDFAESMAVEAQMWDELAPIMARNNVLLCPTTTTSSLPLDHSPTGPGIEIAGARVDADFGWMLTWPFNMLSPLPVMNVPSGVADNGVPIGAQLVGRPFADHEVFGLAALGRADQPDNRDVRSMRLDAALRPGPGRWHHTPTLPPQTAPLPHWPISMRGKQTTP